MAAIDDEFVDPLIEWAQSTEHPLRRNLIMAAAHITRVFHRDVVYGELSPGPFSKHTLLGAQRCPLHKRVTMALQLTKSLLDIHRDL